MQGKYGWMDFLPGTGVSAFFKDHFDFAAYTAEEVTDVFALCFDLRSALELAELIQNNNHGN
jgi:hypothetical protein